MFAQHVGFGPAVASPARERGEPGRRCCISATAKCPALGPSLGARKLLSLKQLSHPPQRTAPAHMCGICGIYEYGRSGAPALDAIEPMTHAIAHRGPDAAGTWCNGRLALGHRRLSIFDLSAAGAQPMHSADGLATVVFNGEIYNFKELRPEHERDGYAFRTGTDTEVLLQHYRRHGVAALDDFRGMFAFALWDAVQERLLLVRDRLGIKPIYYVDRDGVLLFASEIKSLLQHPLVRPQLDRARLSEWFALRFTVAPDTILQGIRKLEPGHYLEASPRGVRKVRYWDVPSGRRPISRGAAEEEYRSLLEDAVRLRLRADVPVGVFLSGGLDSSTIALSAAQLASGPIETFTVGYAGADSISELPRARAVAAQLGATHHELLLDDVAPEVLDDVVWHLEEPIGDPATVLLYRLSEFTRQRVTVVLSGEGSDETNLGYRKLRSFQRWAWLQSLGPLKDIASRAWLGWRVPGVVLNGGRPRETDVYAELTWPEVARRTAAVGAGEWRGGLERLLADAGQRSAFERLLYLDLKGWLGDDLLLKVDKTTMAYALEARVPFLDHKLVEFNLTLPPEWKIDRHGTKRFLRDIVRGRLPADSVDGAQHGFLAPLNHWFSRRWRGRLEEALGEGGLGGRKLVSREYLAAVRAGVAQGDDRALLPAFMLASLETWITRFGVDTGD